MRCTRLHRHFSHFLFDIIWLTVHSIAACQGFLNPCHGRARILLSTFEKAVLQSQNEFRGANSNYSDAETCSAKHAISLYVQKVGGQTICSCCRNSRSHGKPWKGSEEDFGPQEFLQRKHNFAVPYTVYSAQQTHTFQCDELWETC